MVSAGNGKIQTLLMYLVKNKVYEPDFMVNDLLEGDLEAILIFLRNTAFGPDYNFTLRDPKTNNSLKHTFVSMKLNFKKLEKEPEEDGSF